MKKVLIFYGSHGGGHLSAARNIKEYIDLNYNETTETMLVDCVEYASKALNSLSKTAYKEMAKNAHWAWKQVYKNAEKGTFSKISNAANKLMATRLTRLLEDFNPDLIISTHPFASQMSAILKKEGKTNCKIATVMTDYAPHAQWVINHEYVDYFFVAHDGMVEAVTKYGVPENKISVTGIPLSNRFLANYDKEKILADFRP